MKRGELDTEVSMLIDDLRERCGSGRSGSSCHVVRIIGEIHKKVGKGFAGNSVKLKRRVKANRSYLCAPQRFRYPAKTGSSMQRSGFYKADIRSIVAPTLRLPKDYHR
jgi:hypothetical protein